MDGLTIKCQAREFEITIDEPRSRWHNKGMTPVEALLIGLASCKAIVVKAFVRKYKLI